MNLNSKYLKNIAWLFSDTLMRIFSGFIVGIFVARYMGVDNFGLYNYILAVFSVFISLSSLGMNGVVVKELVGSDEQSTILGSALLLQRIGALSTSILLIFWAVFLNQDKPNDFLLVFFLILPTLLIQSSNIYKYWFEYKVSSKYTVIAQNLALVVGVFLKLIIIFFNFNYLYIIAVTIIEQTILTITLRWSFKKHNPKMRLKISKSVCADLFSKSWPLVLSGLSFVLYVRLDQIMIGEILGVKEVGIFSVAVKLIEVWYFLPAIVVSTLFPALIKLRTESVEKYNQKMQLLYDLVAVVGVGIVIGTVCFADLIIKYTFGVEYIRAADQLKIYSVVCLFYFFNSVSGRWYINEGLQKVALFRNLLGLVIAVILNFLLIPRFGLTGASLSTIISYISSAYLFDLFDKRTRVVFYQKSRSLWLFGAIKRLKLEYLKT